MQARISRYGNESCCERSPAGLPRARRSSSYRVTPRAVAPARSRQLAQVPNVPAATPRPSGSAWGWAVEYVREIAHLDARPRSQRDRSLDDIDQLSNVARI